MNALVGDSMWNAPHFTSDSSHIDRLQFSPPDATWKPLHQHWIKGEQPESFQPGWARVSWTPDHLVYDIRLAGRTFRNAARQLNELTWELGDVCEIFVEAVGAGHYLEIHVTPENQRLQLRFPPTGIADVRAGRRPLAEFMVAAHDWVSTETQRAEHHLQVHAQIPAAALGVACLSPALVLRTAVCRYDYTGTKVPLLSSTAPLSAPSFHAREEWTQLRLLTGASVTA